MLSLRPAPGLCTESKPALSDLDGTIYILGCPIFVALAQISRVPKLVANHVLDLSF